MTTNPTPPRDDAPEAVDFLYKHGDLTRSAAYAAISKLTDNGFKITRRADQPARVVKPHDPNCPECKGTGERDSGGTHPWGAPAMLPCDCNEAAALRPTEAGAEPVAWRYEKNGKTFINEHQQPWKANDGWVITPLYATPPAAPTDNTALVERIKFEAEAMRKAVSGESVKGTFHAQNWSDKPHRVVYDACRLIEEAAAALANPAAALAQREDQVREECADRLDDSMTIDGARKAIRALKRSSKDDRNG